jgi:hypothetical protein
MRNLDIGIHQLPARPLYLESTGTVASSTIAVSRIAAVPPCSLPAATLAHMAETPAGDVDVMPVPPEAADIDQRLRGHLQSVYGLSVPDAPRHLPNEWGAETQVLWCNGAAFHDDACFDSVLAVLLWAGPPRDLLLPHLGARVRLVPGVVALFDSAQPHGLLVPGENEFVAAAYPSDTPRSVFCTLDLARDTPGLKALMRFDGSPRFVPAGALRVTGEMGIDAATGRWLPDRYARDAASR